ncbi:uncharacterized protein GGS22DRAFT_195112 [Annulohypoxylon maeteangense]|uniref:uncharacterized protein n=1 Tax=Annulohypoxylon maeteangense TaxID=1927788 RepID=UPI002007823F|nr:uncharacterized protein GGS22DRAFT_195112 [Annulohypoxylon maeteangense]KAI0883980.1 hypothetical protein GGS22DRAFT_195112 [Annulohypoxylon maeteangense]
MARTGGFIIDLNDDQHPYFELSKQNSELPFLRILPPDVRLIIYEMLVYRYSPINPVQVQRYSNKFGLEHEQGYLDPRFTTVYLAQTCRAIYVEIERWNPLYRVNTFQFSSQLRCCEFLAAIVPRKRKQIRRLIIEVEGNPMGAEPVGTTFTLSKELLALLSQCDGVHFNMLRLLMNFRPCAQPAALRNILNQSKDPVQRPGLHYMWELPFFTPEMLFDCIDATHRTVIPLGKEITNALRARTAHDIPQWFKAMAGNNRLLEDAVAATRIQFPGELRITLDKESSSIGSVASRTRAKCGVPNSVGIVEREITRYNVEGILIKDIYITNIRWAGARVECEVANLQNWWDRNWENLTALLEPRHDYRLQQFYRSLISGFRRKQRPLNEMEAIPSPHYIFKIISDILSPEHYSKRAGSGWYSRLAWSSLTTEWDSLAQQEGSETEREKEN